MALTALKIDNESQLNKYQVQAGRRSWHGEGLYVLTTEVRDLEIRHVEVHKTWSYKDLAEHVDTDYQPAYLELLREADKTKLSTEDAEQVS